MGFGKKLGFLQVEGAELARVVLAEGANLEPGGEAELRFRVDVYKGDVYYLMTRWDKAPNFAACNANEVDVSGEDVGQVQLCTERTSEMRTAYLTGGSNPALLLGHLPPFCWLLPAAADSC